MANKEKVLEMEKQKLMMGLDAKDIINEEKNNVGNCLADFQIVTELGRGSYGVVYKVVSLFNHKEYVMKKINIRHMKPKHQKEALKEAQILRKVRHSNIIKYYTSFVEGECLHIIMEYADGGDLQQLIKLNRDKKKSFSETEVFDVAWNLLQAIDYLHRNSIIHRDIKTLNIFLTKERRVKLGDLGVSKIVSSSGALQGTRVGTPLYLAPELVKQQPYDFKVDIWAVGCVLYHMSALEPPFTGDNLISLGYNIVHKYPKPLPSIYSPKLVTLIMKILEKNPQMRPTAVEIIEKFPCKPVSQYQAAGSILESQEGRIDVYDSKNYNLMNKVPTQPQDEEQKRQNGNYDINNKKKTIDVFQQNQQPMTQQKIEQKYQLPNSKQKLEMINNNYNNMDVKVKDNLIYDIISKNEDQQHSQQTQLQQLKPIQTIDEKQGININNKENNLQKDNKQQPIIIKKPNVPLILGQIDDQEKEQKIPSSINQQQQNKDDKLITYLKENQKKNRNSIKSSLNKMEVQNLLISKDKEVIKEEVIEKNILINNNNINKEEQQQQQHQAKIQNIQKPQIQNEKVIVDQVVIQDKNKQKELNHYAEVQEQQKPSQIQRPQSSNIKRINPNDIKTPIKSQEEKDIENHKKNEEDKLKKMLLNEKPKEEGDEFSDEFIKQNKNQKNHIQKNNNENEVKRPQTGVPSQQFQKQVSNKDFVSQQMPIQNPLISNFVIKDNNKEQQQQQAAVLGQYKIRPFSAQSKTRIAKNSQLSQNLFNTNQTKPDNSKLKNLVKDFKKECEDISQAKQNYYNIDNNGINSNNNNSVDNITNQKDQSQKKSQNQGSQQGMFIIDDFSDQNRFNTNSNHNNVAANRPKSAFLNAIKIDQGVNNNSHKQIVDNFMKQNLSKVVQPHSDMKQMPNKSFENMMSPQQKVVMAQMNSKYYRIDNVQRGFEEDNDKEQKQSKEEKEVQINKNLREEQLKIKSISGINYFSAVSTTPTPKNDLQTNQNFMQQQQQQAQQQQRNTNLLILENIRPKTANSNLRKKFTLKDLGCNQKGLFIFIYFIVQNFCIIIFNINQNQNK